MPQGPTVRSVALSLVLGLVLPGIASACDTPESDCPVELGTYRLALPERADTAGAAVPALLYLHGWGGNAAGVMKNHAMRKRLAERGYALIAPEGIPRDDHPNRDWGVRDEGRPERDDIVFLTSVLDDAATRGVDRDRVLIAGFSRGGSMVWDIACHAPLMARAYAPVSGAFWEPLPDRCSGPVALFHAHGWTDSVVPLEGRSVADGALTQGDVFASLAILRRANGCDARQPDAAPIIADGTLWLREWTGCRAGRIDLMVHPGGHGVPKGWLGRALDWFEALDPSG